MAEKQILDTKVGELSLLDGFFIGTSKVITEELFLMTPVGNGSYRSALVKGITAGLLGYVPYIKNYKVTKIVSTGLLVDAVEDAVVATKRQFNLGFAPTGSNSSGVIVM